MNMLDSKVDDDFKRLAQKEQSGEMRVPMSQINRN